MDMHCLYSFLFYKIKPMAAYIYIPYLLWGTFVQYLIEAIISSTELDFIQKIYNNLENNYISYSQRSMVSVQQHD
ncbi:MAG: hypothetical protein IPO72_11700 [Saprospiraceae bacterium]|nr:hypothetical protein [Candidatus Vicinibacter affinis]